LLTRFHLLNKGLSIVLGFIGVKMLLQASHHYAHGVPTISTALSLAVIVGVLAATIIGSLLWPAAEPQESGPQHGSGGASALESIDPPVGTLSDQPELEPAGATEPAAAGTPGRRR
jgi:tellurite resistance protein TerC